MTTEDPDDQTSPGRTLAIVGTALGLSFLVLHFAGGLGWLNALAVLAPVALAFGLIGRRRGQQMRNRLLTNRGSLWPDQGLKTLTDALGTAALLTDGRGIVRFRNEEARALFPNLKPSDPIVIGLRVPVVIEAMELVIANGTPERVEWTQRVPSERWFSARLAPITYPPRPEGRREGFRPDFVLVTIDDLSERRRLERMRSDFVANASHEMRTPLAAVSGFIETLQGPARNDPDARDRFLAIMSEQARRMRRLVDDLLSLSRIEMKAHLQPTDLVDLADVLHRVETTLQPIAEAAGVTLALDLGDGPLPVRGEADELAQVFTNLVENAIKYGGNDKTVTVRATKGRGEDGRETISVAVTDQGPGIPPEHLPRLTERFYRVDVASSRAKQGTGLGLAIVKHIMTRHRGRLSIASEPGEGATFTAIFPRDAGS